MKIALIGYGKMGHMIETIALQRGHSITCKIDKDNLSDFDSVEFAQSNVAIEFTTPQTAVQNIRLAWRAKVPVVCGTTGWTDQLSSLKNELETNGSALFWSSNYSLGVYLLRLLNDYLSRLMQPFSQYKVSISETHHIHKLDAPSGTAKTLAEDIENLTHKKVDIDSFREGNVAGIHTITYESDVDTISIMHSAKSREGFALGAVMAAEFLYGKHGFFEMKDMMNEWIK